MIDNPQQANITADGGQINAQRWESQRRKHNEPTYKMKGSIHFSGHKVFSH
jgi:hypothetical protein